LESSIRKRRRNEEAEVDFVAAFDGDAVARGRINTRKLAPTLFALAALVERSTEAITGRREEVTVQVRADFRRGSFEFVIAVVGMVGAQLWANLSVSDIALILQSIGFTGNNPNSLFRLLLSHGDKRIERGPTLSDGRVQAYVQGDNAQVTIINIDSPVANLLFNENVREAVAEVVEPVTAEGIDSFRIGPRRQPVLSIGKADLPKLRAPKPAEIELADDTAQTAVELLSPNFVEGNKWRVSQGGEPFWVSILDKEFLDSVESGQRQFAKGDYLIVRLRTRAFATDRGLSAEREVVKVINHQHRGHQGSLFDSNAEGSQSDT
jgi:hypothetical protein